MVSHKKYILLTILTISAITLSAASPAELQIFPGESTTKVDSYTSFEVELTNTGTTGDAYQISSSSPSEITIAPRRVPETGTLSPGETKKINVWFNPEFDREQGTYPFTITAASRSTGQRYSVDGQVTIITEHSVNVQTQDQVVCLGEEARYEVEVTNDGIQQERFNLETDRGSLSERRVTLQAGETKTVYVTTSSNREVSESFNIRANSDSSYASDVETVRFTAETCFNSEIEINPDRQDVAAHTEAEMEVQLRNTGTRQDEFSLSTNLGELEDETLTIDGETTASTTLRYAPTTLRENRVRVSSSGQSEASGSAVVNTYNGMNVDASFSNEPRTVCENEQFTERVQIENTGEATETYKIRTNTGELQRQEITLEPGETTTVRLNVDAENFREETTNDINVEVVSTTFGEPVEKIHTNFTVDNCYDLELSVVPSVSQVGENRSTIYEVRMHNTGSQINTYDISVDSEEWISARPERVTVESGKTESAYIYAGIPFRQQEGITRIDVTVEGTEVKKQQTVQLVVGDRFRDKVRSHLSTGMTGMFSQQASAITNRLPSLSSLGAVVISAVLGLLLSGVILYRETK